MALYSTDGTVSGVNVPASPHYRMLADMPWSSGDAGLQVYDCAGDVVGPAYSGGAGAYYVGCSVEWTEPGEEEEPGPTLPEGFDVGTAGELFAAGFGIVFSFWALGKVAALVMDLLRR